MRYPVAISLLLVASVTVAAFAQSLPPQDWPMFGGNVESTSANPSPTGITARNVAQLALIKALTCLSQGHGVDPRNPRRAREASSAARGLQYVRASFACWHTAWRGANASSCAAHGTPLTDCTSG
jgi:hypothetical protein